MLHRRVSPTTLGVVRAAVFGMWIWHVLMDPFTELGGLSVERLEPLGILRLLPAEVWQLLCGTAGLVGLKTALLLCLACLSLGLGPFRPLAFFTCALLVLYQGLVRGAGHMTHGELPMIYAAMSLAPFPCTDGFALRRGGAAHRHPALYRAPLVIGGLTLCLTYAMVGARRLELGGVGIFLDGTILSHVARRSAERGGPGLALVQHLWLGRFLGVAFVLVTACEVLSPLALFHPWFRRVWIVVLLGFHAATSLLMGISFRGNVVLLGLFLTDIDAAVRFVSQRLTAKR